jgi:hypothetical protein
MELLLDPDALDQEASVEGVLIVNEELGLPEKGGQEMGAQGIVQVQDDVGTQGPDLPQVTEELQGSAPSQQEGPGQERMFLHGGGKASFGGEEDLGPGEGRLQTIQDRVGEGHIPERGITHHEESGRVRGGGRGGFHGGVQ